MPGSALYDYGDAIRSGASTAAEDETDLSKVHLDPVLFESFTRGFLEGTAGSLTQAELDLLPMGAKLMTLECGIRFLTDYLQNDVYFKTDHPTHNLEALPYAVYARCGNGTKLGTAASGRIQTSAGTVRFSISKRTRHAVSFLSSFWYFIRCLKLIPDPGRKYCSSKCSCFSFCFPVED